jgi:hypothetical protein
VSLSFTWINGKTFSSWENFYQLAPLWDVKNSEEEGDLWLKAEQNLQLCCLLQSHHKGKYLLEYVCRQLNLIEKDYFGLRYVDSSRQRVSLFAFYKEIVKL